MSLLQDLMFPKKYDYKLSEKLFLDIWESYGSKKEILDKKEIYEFLKEIVVKSEGYVILDHFSYINYDCIKKIEYKEPYFYIYWREHHQYREKYLNKTIAPDELGEWHLFGFATYSYVMIDIKKIKFIKKENHLFILLLPNLISSKNVENALIDKEDTLISKENNKNQLYTEYMFWEGDIEKCIKHICAVSNLPYYTCLIQPKEGCTSSPGLSKDILLAATLDEIDERVDKVYKSVSFIDKYDHDELFAKGNTIRRIIEYTLKYLCVYKGIEIKGKDLEENYGDILLGALKKTINKTIDDLNINQSFINMANELSHDSGVVFDKEDIIKFCDDAKLMIKEIRDIIFKDEELF